MAAGGKRRSFYADLDHMRNLFDSVDANKTGYVGYQELCALVRNIPEIEEAAVPELMKQLDRDKDGKVNNDCCCEYCGQRPPFLQLLPCVVCVICARSHVIVLSYFRLVLMTSKSCLPRKGKRLKRSKSSTQALMVIKCWITADIRHHFHPFKNIQ